MQVTTPAIYTGPDGLARNAPLPRTHTYLNKLAMKFVHCDGQYCTAGSATVVAAARSRLAFEAQVQGTVRFAPAEPCTPHTPRGP